MKSGDINFIRSESNLNLGRSGCVHDDIGERSSASSPIHTKSASERKSGPLAYFEA